MKSRLYRYIKSSFLIPLLGTSIAVSASNDIQIERYAPTLSANDVYARDIIKLNFAHPTAANNLKFTSTYGETDAQYSMHVGTENSNFMFFRGNGERYNQLNQGSLDLDPYFFHGGGNYNYRYQGLSSEFKVAKSTHVQFAYNKLFSGNLDPRSAWYSGISHNNFTAGATVAYRENDPTASGIVFSHSGKSSDLHVQEIQHEAGSRYRSLSWRREQTNRWYDFSFQSGRNPLYLANNENRVMFRFGGTLGRKQIAFNASDDGASEIEDVENPEQQKKSRGGTVLVAGLVIGAAAAGSSGDDRLDNSNRFSQQHDAGFVALDNINPVSVRQNREHGGWIYRNGDGSFGFTDPVAGMLASVDIGNPDNVIPRGHHRNCKLSYSRWTRPSI